MSDNNGWRGHDGNVLGYTAYPFYLPSQRMTLVVLFNSSRHCKKNPRRVK